MSKSRPISEIGKPGHADMSKPPFQTRFSAALVKAQSRSTKAGRRKAGRSATGCREATAWTRLTFVRGIGHVADYGSRYVVLGLQLKTTCYAKDNRREEDEIEVENKTAFKTHDGEIGLSWWMQDWQDSAQLCTLCLNMACFT